METIACLPSARLDGCEIRVERQKVSVHRPEVKFAARPAPSGSSPPGAGGNFRWVVCSLLFFSVGINYLDRLVLSILKNDLSAVFGWSETDYGWITAAFSFAYAFIYFSGVYLLALLGIQLLLPTLARPLQPATT